MRKVLVVSQQSMNGLFLAILAAICWGVAPVAAKLALQDVSPMIGMSVRSALAALMVLTWLIASGHYHVIAQVDGRSMTWLVIEALLATVVGDALYFSALKHSHAGQVSLIMAASPLITLLTAVLLLGEPLSEAKVIGAALVIGGLLLIGI
jgi:transporter family protein